VRLFFAERIIVIGGSELEDQSKRSVHIKWHDPWRAERERESVRQAYPMPTSNPLRVFAANVSRKLTELKAMAFRSLGGKFH